MKIMRTNMFVLFLFLFLSLSFEECNNAQSKDISIQKFKEIISKENDVAILDVRTEREVKGELPKINSALHIPIDELKKRINELSDYKNKEIFVICYSGIRSARGVKILIENGFKAINVLGGMQEFYNN